MPNSSTKEIQILQKKAADLEAKLEKKEAVIVEILSTHRNEKETLATALQEAEQQREEAELQRQELATRNEALRLEMEEKDRIHQEKIDALIAQHMLDMRARFGRKTERFVDAESPQENLFPNLESEDPTTKDTAPEDIENIVYTGGQGIPSASKKSRGPRKPRDKSGIPIRENLIPVPEAERTCSCCGKEKEVIGHESRERLNYQPAVFELVIDKREKMACRNGCEKQLVTAPLTPSMLLKCKATASLLAYMCVSKVLDRQPLYHLEKTIEQRHHWYISRQTMSRWMIMLGDALQPLVGLMKDQLESYDIAAIDATTLQVRHEPQRSSTVKSQAYCIRGGPPEKSVILYEYNAYKQGDYVEETLHFFKGILHCDASPVFNKIGKQEGVTLSYCYAHARRKFEEIVKLSPKGKPSLAKEALILIGDLYKVERQASNSGLSPEARHALRQEKSRPIVSDFYDWLMCNKDRTLTQSPIGKAIAYALNHWDGLQAFLLDGRVEIDNNATERDIKPFVIARKNFLFSCTPKGADSLAVHFSLILTARLHGLDPMAYYTDIFTRIPLCKNTQDLELLLPWNWKKY